MVTGNRVRRNAEGSARSGGRGLGFWAAITASATCGQELGELETRGKVDVPVAVALTDEAGTQVAAMTVHWHLRRRHIHA